MWSKFSVGLILAVATILFSQAAMAHTRVYLNFGFPVIDLEYRAYHGPDYVVREVPACAPPERVYVVHDYMPYPYRIWVAGYRHWDGYRQVWVPGHWELVSPRHDAPEFRDRDNHGDRDWHDDRDRWEDRD
jgi:hypothetical protein